LGMWTLGIPLCCVIRHRPEQYGYLPDGEISADPGPTHRGHDLDKTRFREALRSGNLWKIAVAEAIRSMISMAVVTHVMPYLSSIGMSRSSAAFVATSIPLFSIIGRLGFGWLSDMFDRRHVLVGAYCLLGVGTVAFSYIHVTWLIFPFLLTFSPALGGALPLRGAVVSEYFGRSSFGSLVGAIKGVAAIGGIIGPPAAGWTFDNVGSYQPVWLSFAGAAVIAALLVLRVKGSPRISEQ